MSRCLFDGIRGVLCEGDVVEENCRFFVGDCRTYRKEKTCFVKSMENHIVRACLFFVIFWRTLFGILLVQ